MQNNISTLCTALRNGLDLKCKAWGTYTVEPLYNGYHWEPTFSEMSLTQGLLVYFQQAWYCVIVEHNMATFQSFPLLHTGREGQADVSIVTNSAVYLM